MRKLIAILPLALLSFCASNAFAAHLSCNNSTSLPNKLLISYDFSLQILSSGGGGGGGAGKPVSSLVVQIPFDATYGQLSTFVTNGHHSSSCVLTDTPDRAPQVEITLHDVTFSKIELLSGSSFNIGKAGTVVQLTLSYASVTTSQGS